MVGAYQQGLDRGRALFSRADFVRLADQLAALRGRFLLSINDVPEIRALFAWATVEAVTTTYSVARRSAGGQDRPELLIRNF